MSRLKPLEDQVIVLTGAASGLGLVTARLAAERGARLVLAGRDEPALRRLADEINGNGGEALAVACDVSIEGDAQRLHDATIERFGDYDTWINDAGESDTTSDDAKAVFQTTVAGVFHGTRQAVGHFKQRTDQRFHGSLINVGSVSSETTPQDAIHVASQHAVKGLTDALRQEVRLDKLPVNVALVVPSADATPDDEAACESVARAILHAAQHRTRGLGASDPLSMLGAVLPSVVETFVLAVLPSSSANGDRGESGATRLPSRIKAHPLTSAALSAGAALIISAVAGVTRDDADDEL
ncbi:MAG: SDR family NAD(P)-dependent oxidoreductase [Planctomycetota bacterium]